MILYGRVGNDLRETGPISTPPEDLCRVQAYRQDAAENRARLMIRESTSVPLPTPTVGNRTDSGESVWSPEAVHILGKPAGAICNLGCSYCFFLDKEALYERDRFRMSEQPATSPA